MEKVLEIVNTAKTYYLYDRMQNLVQVIQPKEADVYKRQTKVIVFF